MPIGVLMPKFFGFCPLLFREGSPRSPPYLVGWMNRAQSLGLTAVEAHSLHSGVGVVTLS